MTKPAFALAAEAPPLGPAPHEGPLFWPPQVFSVDQGDRLGDDPIDLTGRERHIFFGPFEVLAAGLWMARVDLDLCPDAAKRALTFEFGVEPEMAALDVSPGAPGRRAIELIQAIRAPGPAQARLRLRRAAFHGMLYFGGVALTRLGSCDAGA